MAFWTYMLKCADGRFYVGHTDDLEARVGQHELGRGSDFTTRRRPVVLVWCENFPSREEALTAELRIKGWTRAKKEALIAGDWQRIHGLAVSREARPSTALRTNGVGVEPDAPFVLSEVEARATSAPPTP